MKKIIVFSLITLLAAPASLFSLPQLAHAAPDTELWIGGSPYDPDASTIKVDETSITEGVSIFLFELHAREENVIVQELPLLIQTGFPSASPTTYENIIESAVLEIAGVEYSVSNTEVFAQYDDLSTRAVTFDFGSGITIDPVSPVTAKLIVDFKPREGNYPQGSYVRAYFLEDYIASIVAVDMQGVPVPSVPVNGREPKGEHHSLFSKGIFAEIVSTDEEVITLPDGREMGSFAIEFDVTAFESDAYVPRDAVPLSSPPGTSGFFYRIESPDSLDLSYASSTQWVTSNNAAIVSDYFFIPNGETKTFTLHTNLEPEFTGAYESYLHAIGFFTEIGGELLHHGAQPYRDFITDPLSITGTPGPQTTAPEPSFVSATVPNPYVEVGDRVYYDFYLHNSGGTLPFLWYTEIRNTENGELVNHYFNNNFSMDPDDTHSFGNIWTPEENGEYALSIGLFSTDWSHMYEWSNEVAMFYVGQLPPAPLQPEPSLDQALIVSATNEVGSLVALNTLITNNESDATFIVYAEIYDATDDSYVDYVLIEDFSTVNGNQAILNLLWTPSEAGEYYFSVAFFSSDWSELYEWNHRVADVEVVESTTPMPFALSYTSTYSPSSIVRGDTLTVDVTASNTGDAGEGHIYAMIYDEDLNVVHDEWFEFESFGNEESRTFTTNWETQENGIYYIDFGLFSNDWSEMFEWKWRANEVEVVETAVYTLQ